MKREIRFTNRDLSEIIKGDHKYQKRKTFSGDMASKVNVKEKYKARKIGERWVELDEDGNVACVWEQRDGYRIKVIHPDEIHYSWAEFNYPNCEAACEKTKSKQYTSLDKKYRNIYGMCTQCAAKYETKLKTSGEWKEFERMKMLANAKAFFNDADAAVSELADRMKNPEFVNDDGSVEKWSGKEADAEALVEEYNMYKNLIVETLEGKNNGIVVI